MQDGMEQNRCQQVGEPGDMQRQWNLVAWGHHKAASTRDAKTAAAVSHSPPAPATAEMDLDHYSAFCDGDNTASHDTNPQSFSLWRRSFGGTTSNGTDDSSNSHNVSTHVSLGDGSSGWNSGRNSRGMAATTGSQRRTAGFASAQQQQQQQPQQSVDAAGSMDAMIDPSVDMSCLSFRASHQKPKHHQHVHHQQQKQEQAQPMQQPRGEEEEAAHLQHRLQYMTLSSNSAPVEARSTSITHAQHQRQQQEEQLSDWDQAQQSLVGEAVTWDDCAMHCIADEPADEERELTVLMDQTQLTPTGHGFQMPYIS